MVFVPSRTVVGVKISFGRTMTLVASVHMESWTKDATSFPTCFQLGRSIPVDPQGWMVTKSGALVAKNERAAAEDEGKSS